MERDERDTRYMLENCYDLLRCFLLLEIHVHLIAESDEYFHKRVVAPIPPLASPPHPHKVCVLCMHWWLVDRCDIKKVESIIQTDKRRPLRR